MTFRLVHLRTGGAVVLSAEYDEARCGDAEHQLLFALADALQEYAFTTTRLRRASSRSGLRRGTGSTASTSGGSDG